MHFSGSNFRNHGVRKVKRLLPLVSIEIFVWLILLAVTFIISKGVFAISFGTATLIERVSTQVIRVSVSAGLVLMWLLLWKWVADYYLSRTVIRPWVNA